MKQEAIEESALVKRHCQPCEGGVEPLKPDAVRSYLQYLHGWELLGNEIRKAFKFRNHHEVMAFVNALAWVSHREDHHPDMEVGYNYCRVRYQTHAIGGLSENDFICAAKVDALVSI